MVPYQKEQISFTIANAGQTGFYFMWFVNSKLYSDRVKFNFKDQEGYVSANTDIRSTVAITPLKNTVLKHVKIKLKVKELQCKSVLHVANCRFLTALHTRYV